MEPTDDAGEARDRAWSVELTRAEDRGTYMVKPDRWSWNRGYAAGYAQALKDVRVADPEVAARLDERAP